VCGTLRAWATNGVVVFHIEPRPPGGPRRRVVWPWFLGGLIAVAVLLVTANVVVSMVFRGSTGAENARDQVLEFEAPKIVRDVEVANPEPGNRGPAAVALFQERLGRFPGNTILGSSSVPGRPSGDEVAGWVDVRMERTAAGDTWVGNGEEETAVICVRFEALAFDYRFKEIDCR
jgi:hypothetical protein